MNIAVIPARGGSKRIPRKNIKDFMGKPMIAWSIEAARQSGLFDKVLVTTDDDEIAAVAEAHGAWVPFRRPAELADDFATTRQVINHALQWLIDNQYSVDYCCCLYATAPFVTSDILVKAFQQLGTTGKSFCFSATSFAFPIQRAFYFTDNGGIAMFDESQRLTRSQDLTEAFHDAGQFYWGKTDGFLQNLPMFSAHSSAYVLPRYRVQDIDTPEDWQTAEVIFKAVCELERD